MSDFKTPNLDAEVDSWPYRAISAGRFGLMMTAVKKDLRAIVAEKDAELVEVRDTLECAKIGRKVEVDGLREEIAALKAKMATMVCGTCFGEKQVVDEANSYGDERGVIAVYDPCPTCQPKGSDDAETENL